LTKLKLIVGSRRPNRAADLVIPWLTKKIESHSHFETEILDLKDWDLPLFQEHQGSIGDINDPTYSEPVVREWNRKIREAEAMLILTPEYLHGMPGLLKNALDNVFLSFAFRNKPVAAVSYSSGIAGGSRALENLAHVALEAEMILLRNTVIIPFVGSAFDDNGNPTNPTTDAAATVMLDDLEWWSKLLAGARANGELPPGSVRLRSILANTAKS
jgi:NAD(P)H-dependent FMN reductase